MKRVINRSRDKHRFHPRFWPLRRLRWMETVHKASDSPCSWRGYSGCSADRSRRAAATTVKRAVDQRIDHRVGHAEEDRKEEECRVLSWSNRSHLYNCWSLCTVAAPSGGGFVTGRGVIVVSGVICLTESVVGHAEEEYFWLLSKIESTNDPQCWLLLTGSCMVFTRFTSGGVLFQGEWICR